MDGDEENLNQEQDQKESKSRTETQLTPNINELASSTSVAEDSKKKQKN